jgi:hypothetical protein
MKIQGREYFSPWVDRLSLFFYTPEFNDIMYLDEYLPIF